MSTPIPVTISFIVPALNEQRVIASVVAKIVEVVRDRFLDWEIILINDGSSDATGEIMDRLGREHAKVRVLHNQGNLGLGASYQRGLQDARFDYVMLLCGDGGLPASSLPVLFEQIGKADIVVPYMLNLKKIKTPFRYFVSRTYTTLLNTLFGFGLHYYNGLPIHRTSLVRGIQIVSRGFGFQGEVLVKLLKSGCTYVEVGTLGAEETRRSFALRPGNVLSVAKTLLHLVFEIMRFRPISKELIAKSRETHPDVRHVSH